MTHILLGSPARLNMALVQRQEFIVNRMNFSQRKWAHLVNDVSHPEDGFVRSLLCNPDREVLPFPSQLILVGQIPD
jgi:hypothetical protein